MRVISEISRNNNNKYFNLLEIMIYVSKFPCNVYREQVPKITEIKTVNKEGLATSQHFDTLVS